MELLLSVDRLFDNQRLLRATLANEVAFLFVNRQSSMLEICDLGTAHIRNIYSSSPGRFVATAMLYCGMQWSMENDLDTVSGHFNADPGMEERVALWYQKRGIDVNWYGQLCGSTAHVYEKCEEILTESGMQCHYVGKDAKFVKLRLRRRIPGES